MQKLRAIPDGSTTRLVIITAGKYAFLAFVMLLAIAVSEAFRMTPQSVLPTLPVTAAGSEVTRHSTLNADVFQKYVGRTSQRMYPRLCREIVDSAIRYSAKYDLSPILVLAVVEAESQFYTFALSKQKAGGLMQINSEANQEVLLQEGIFKGPEDLFDPDRNIEAGCFLLRRYINECSDLNKALDKYLGANSVSYKAEIHSVMGRILLLGITEELNKTAQHKIEPIARVEASGRPRN